jgi:TM2 domain-containing membrane protein YozV
MNDFNDTNQIGTHDGAPTAFCQNCGKPLNDETKRVVGPAIFCEPCLAARLAGAPGASTAGYAPVNPVAGPYVPPPPSGPNPGLAALLGFIPGVGAMYNEQYAKGIVHLMVFAVLVTLASDVNGIFGLFIAGWEFYMIIEAHHTAKARRDGTQLPNPFGLNDIGERLGFGRAWPPSPGVGDVAHDAARAAAETLDPSSPNFGRTPPPAAAWRAPTDEYARQQAAYAYAQQTPPYQPYAAPGYAYVPPAATSYGNVYGPPAPVEVPVVPQNRFPAGAVWLIGLGVFFLLATTGIFQGIRHEALVGVALLGLAGWIFMRRMLETGGSLENDGTPNYSLRVLRALRFSVWIALVGMLFLLNTFHVLSWSRGWPWFIIVAGVMTLLERAAFNSAAAAAYAHAPAAAAAPSTPASTGTSIVPSGDSAPLQSDDHTKGGN